MYLCIVSLVGLDDGFKLDTYWLWLRFLNPEVS